MQKNFQGFANATLENLQAMTEFLIREYNFTKVEIKALMQESFSGFTYATPESLRIVIEFLINEYSFTKVEVKTLIQKNFYDFTNAKQENLWAVSEFLIKGIIKIDGQNQVAFDWEGKNFTKAEVKELMQKSLRGFARITLENLGAVSEFLIREYSFTKTGLKALMQESFSGFASATPEGLRAVVEFLINEYNFTKTEVKTLMQESFSGFVRTTSERLQAITGFLIKGTIKINGQNQALFDWERENFTKVEVKKLIQKSLGGFTNATPKGLLVVAEFLIREYGFTKIEMKALMQESFSGFARATPESLLAVSEFLIKGAIKINGQNQVVFDWKGENFTKVEVKELMQKGFRGFYTCHTRESYGCVRIFNQGI